MGRWSGILKSYKQTKGDCNTCELYKQCYDSNLNTKEGIQDMLRSQNIECKEGLRVIVK